MTELKTILTFPSNFYRWGRKRTLLSCVVPFLIGWILIATASHIAQLYVARFIFGIATGFVFTLLPMYCGEIAEVSLSCIRVHTSDIYNLDMQSPKILAFLLFSGLKNDNY